MGVSVWRPLWGSSPIIAITVTRCCHKNNNAVEGMRCDTARMLRSVIVFTLLACLASAAPPQTWPEWYSHVQTVTANPDTVMR